MRDEAAMVMGFYFAQFAATLLMTGVIWFVQVVHYPLFVRVGEREFAVYEAEHTLRTGWVVGPPMLVEVATATLALLPGLRPDFFPMWAAILGEMLVGVTWLSTAALQIPLHRQLIGGYEARAAARLVSSNRVRTACWSLRAVLLIWVTVRAF